MNSPNLALCWVPVRVDWRPLLYGCLFFPSGLRSSNSLLRWQGHEWMWSNQEENHKWMECFATKYIRNGNNELIANYGYIEVVDGRNLFFVCIKKPYLWEAYKVRWSSSINLGYGFHAYCRDLFGSGSRFLKIISYNFCFITIRTRWSIDMWIDLRTALGSTPFQEVGLGTSPLVSTPHHNMINVSILPSLI